VAEQQGDKADNEQSEYYHIADEGMKQRRCDDFTRLDSPSLD
jgi:hypothetical protein